VGEPFTIRFHPALVLSVRLEVDRFGDAATRGHLWKVAYNLPEAALELRFNAIDAPSDESVAIGHLDDAVSQGCDPDNRVVWTSGVANKVKEIPTRRREVWDGPVISEVAPDVDKSQPRVDISFLTLDQLQIRAHYASQVVGRCTVRQSSKRRGQVLSFRDEVADGWTVQGLALHRVNETLSARFRQLRASLGIQSLTNLGFDKHRIELFLSAASVLRQS
jgi:hypothetical protein